MSTQNVRSILRIVAVLTILVGGIGVSTSLIAAFAIQTFVSADGPAIQHSVAGIGWIGMLSWVAVVAWGMGLYQLSPGIAHHITSEPAATGTVSKPVTRESASR